MLWLLPVVAAPRRHARGDSGNATAAQFVDAAEGVYWDARGMDWEVRGERVVFPRNPDRAPVRLSDLYFLAGVSNRQTS